MLKVGIFDRIIYMKKNIPESNLAKEIGNYVEMALSLLDLSEKNSIEIYLEHPKEEKNGDLSTNIALTAFSKISASGEFNSPLDLAMLLKEKLEERGIKEICERVEVIKPGFINFFVKEEVWLRELDLIRIMKDKYGKSEWGKGKKWNIEHTSPNPNKAMHLGHLRNNVTGMAVANIWEELGIEVLRDCVFNNRGIAIAKLMWGYLKYGRKDGKEITDIDYWADFENEWWSPEEMKVKPDKFVDKFYILGADDFKDNKETEEKVRRMVVDWEEGKKNNWKLWRKVLNYSHEGQNATLKRLGSRWDKVWYEHEHYKKGKELVEEGLNKGIFKKTDDGAVVTDLEKEFGLSDTILIKNDGTSLYITQDLALTKLKKETLGADKLFWVIGPEQALAMKQVFAVCSQLGIGKLDDFTHLAYGYISISGEGKMSSRMGNVIYIDDLIDMVKLAIKEEMKIEEFSEEKIEDIAEKLALGAVKYTILKMGRLTDMAFNIEKSIALDGDSGVYINYSFARGMAILKKSNIKELEKIDKWERMEEDEKQVIAWLVRYPEVVFKAGLEYSPNLIASYIYELCQKFNSFYNKEKVIGSEKEKERLILVEAFLEVVKNGMKLLGIELVERM